MGGGTPPRRPVLRTSLKSAAIFFFVRRRSLRSFISSAARPTSRSTGTHGQDARATLLHSLYSDATTSITRYIVGDRLLIIASDHNQGVFVSTDLSQEYDMDKLVQSVHKFVAVDVD